MRGTTTACNVSNNFEYKKSYDPQLKLNLKQIKTIIQKRKIMNKEEYLYYIGSFSEENKIGAGCVVW